MTTFLSDSPVVDVEKSMLIGGQWVQAASGATFASLNPATGQEIARIPDGGAADINRAVAAARGAFQGPWRKVKPAQRQAILLRLADLVDADYDRLARLDTIDMGMPVSILAMRKASILTMIRFYAGLAMNIRGEIIETSLPGEFSAHVVKEPIGVVGAITAWNGPFAANLLKICPVLASGCTLVLKPAPEGCLAPLALGELIEQLDLPDGVVNIVTGGAEAGATLAAHPDVDKIAMTGSLGTAQKIIQASAGNLKRLSLELGGKSPDIVFADADLDQAVPGAAMGIFGNTGQICVAGSRLFVERSIYEEFTQRVVDFAQKLRIGNGLDPETQIGPLAFQLQMERVDRFIKDAQSEGARVMTGGARLTGGDYDKGCFLAPTVLADVRDDMRVAREEIFGPVLSTFAFDTVDEVVERANASNFGLAGAVWTSDMRKAHQVASRLQAGTVWVNCYLMNDPAVPFGGYKMSGYGREGGARHLDEFLQTKSIVTRLS